MNERVLVVMYNCGTHGDKIKCPTGKVWVVTPTHNFTEINQPMVPCSI